MPPVVLANAHAARKILGVSLGATARGKYERLEIVKGFAEQKEAAQGLCLRRARAEGIKTEQEIQERGNVADADTDSDRCRTNSL